MSLADHQRDIGVGSPTRPGSSWTNSSLFADSAISIRTGTPGPQDKCMSSSRPHESLTQSGIADRLNGLVSEIWAIEQDGAIREDKRRKLERAMDQIEAALEDDSRSSDESDAETAHLKHSSTTATGETVAEHELEYIRTRLSSTVHSMCMRQQEQRHLYQLTIEKLEAVAQRCIQQERRLREFSEEIVLWKDRNRLLAEENKRVKGQLDQTRSESAKKEIAVNAMSSAVAGLEGWINNSPTPNRTPRRIVTRGRGRFRGRYYVDEPIGGPEGHGSDGASDVKVLHEGVTAWLRGFRDVEEELRFSESVNNPRSNVLQNAPENTEDERGEFESAPRT
ncbi:uncharacterized protein Z518_08079 [Rhinocladiella mackenziei CBS 650.93]|uniref:Uncharacterized protein n=1 Tax=Rhinocladiella mackenziei CBS 650.93 TaxID=1442369 RepID=A0A0D2IZU4_9EURO|nr:uncharacterized protein Z518_08079 [Rhinocladiella mackenziei CBS 650.93]KIX02140.1 hypothetical protein Z518_08079 [Rhinocladiella mackenziei CBS 650.93]